MAVKMGCYSLSVFIMSWTRWDVMIDTVTLLS